LGVYSYTKSERLLKRSDFIRISKIGKKLHNRYFTAIYSHSLNEKTRIGITVTRRVGKAATRNRIKRFIRESFRLSKNDIRGTWDVNIIAKHQAADIQFKEAFASMKRIINNISGSKDY